ncbi:hypothetical protein Q3W71_04605 [Micromonospora sp. C28SCA-DRY-2]|uniref:hypothetical protein n=1 Tax=Micromonospora sp. C28SCA-DRY-2 TaxID=3059522 RepID=UPI0026760645|nr:hypothetical protein [Micromonospora sp. C28SCA-DRY-2]MDO3700958.1 hypothetical protein [Micromonospora sp. C28SCA-DRY-2]
MSTEIVELEIARNDWDALRCGCGGSAAHVAEELLALARAEDDARFEVLEGHVMTPEVLLEPALPVVSVALAALADRVAPPARLKFLEMLLLIVSAESQSAELALLGRDLPGECRSAAATGLWLLYSEVFAGASVGSSSYAYEILTIIEEDPDRLERVREAAGDRLSWDLR